MHELLQKRWNNKGGLFLHPEQVVYSVQKIKTTCALPVHKVCSLILSDKQLRHCNLFPSLDEKLSITLSSNTCNFILLARSKQQIAISTCFSWDGHYKVLLMTGVKKLSMHGEESKQNKVNTLLLARCLLNTIHQGSQVMVTCYLIKSITINWPPSTCLHPLLFSKPIPAKQNSSDQII